MSTDTRKTENIQWWLASLDRYGNPTLEDGAHSNRDGAEKALSIIRGIGLGKGKQYAIAEVHLSGPTGEHEPVDEDAVRTCREMCETWKQRRSSQ